MFVALAGSELALGTGATAAPTLLAQSSDHFPAPAALRELAADAFFGPIFGGPGAAATLGKPVDRHGAAVLDTSLAPPGSPAAPPPRARAPSAPSRAIRHAPPGVTLNKRFNG